MPQKLLRLNAEDRDDLTVIAAAMQDAIFIVRDLVVDRRGRRFVATVNRFRWETANVPGPWERVRSALAVESVLGVRSRNVKLGAHDAAGAMLDIAFAPAAEPPGGVIAFKLAGDGEIALDVECIDVTLTDIGPAWPTPNRPDHGRL
jgi:hypothetical protein